MANYAWENKGLDEHSAKELFLWIENDGDLYRRQYTPIIKNLVAKKARGVYDSTKAAKLFGYLAESGAKSYNKQVGDGVERIPSYFPKKVRDAVAEELRDRFEDEYELGNYDHYTPKKYQKKAAKKKTARKKSSPRLSVRGLR